MKKPERLSRKVIYRNKWVSLFVDKVKFPGGRIIGKHHFIEMEKPAVGTLVEDGRGRILLVNAYRYTTNSVEWESPGGWVDEGESVIETAKREILEETGYDSADHKQVLAFYPQGGISNHKAYIVFCRSRKKISDFDKNEIKKIKWFSKEEVKEMIRKNVIKDGYTLIALMLYLSK